MRTALFTFKQEEAAKLYPQWGQLWLPLRMHFLWFADKCSVDLKTPPLVITCIARTPDENTAVGGVPKSLHMTTPVRAIDIRRLGFDNPAMVEAMKAAWQSKGVGWDFVIEGSPYNEKPPHFHLEADRRVT